MWKTVISILLFFCLIYGMYGMLTCTIVRWCKKPVTNKKGKQVQPKLTVAEMIPCYIPLYQVVVLRKALYRSAPVCSIVASVSAICIVTRLVNIFIPINSYVMFATVIMMYIGLICHILLYGIVTADCARTYGYGWFMTLLCFLLPYWMAYFLRSLIPNKMIAMQKEDTFSERNGDTYIKSRHN